MFPHTYIKGCNLELIFCNFYLHQGLTRDKSELEVEYEKLLTINETLAADLELAIRQKKTIAEEQVD